MKLIINRISKSTHDSVTLNFKKQFEYKAGQHVALTFIINGEEHSRTYSFNSSPYSDDDAEITVRAIQGGIVSNFLVNNTSLSMEVEMSGVLGDFFVEPSNERRHLIMFAGGSGITPIMSMLKTVLYREPESVISLIYSNRKVETIIFRNELAALEDQFSDRFKIYHVITNPVQAHVGFPVFYQSQLNKLVVRKVVKSLLEQNDRNTEFYLCGPQGFMTVIEEALSSLNIDKSRVFREHFFIANQDDAQVDFRNLPAREITVQWQGEAKSLTVTSGKSILDAAFDINLFLPHSCREGHCGVCRSLLVRGNVKLRKNHILTKDELAASQVLLCQGYPVTDDVIVKPINQQHELYNSNPV